MYERWVQLKGCRHVDEIIPYSTEEDLMNLLASQKIDVRFVGEDYMDKDFTGKQWCVDNNVTLIYNKRKHNYSTTNLRKRMAL
jgi:glycerol-3-phosphate cytidylyltransferase